MNGKEFSAWMEEVGMDLEKATRFFGVSAQTIYNWRSTAGVPPSKTKWVRERMREYLGSAPIAAVPDRITLLISTAQFDAWEDAALARGKKLRQWAVDVLDEAAEADGDGDHGGDHVDQPPEPYDIAPVQMPRAAEEGAPEYSEKKEPA
jgi:hypothetical protein